MGLIKAAVGAAGGVLADQWKEFFYCDSLDKEVLAVKGQKRVSGRSSNTKGNDNIITNGSGISVSDGQCMIIVDQGKIVEYCAEPGVFTYDASTEPSVFSGSFGESLKETFKTIGKRFTYGGDTAKDQRVYYFNTKELLDNKFGTQNPIQFKVRDDEINLNLTIGIRCNGVYSYRISNPLLFYTNVCGNISDEYRREELDSTLKSEFLGALQPALGKLSAKKMDYTEIPMYTLELADEMNAFLSSKWSGLRGLSIVSIGINSVTASEEDVKKIQRLQEATAMGSNAFAMAGRLTNAQAQAMEDAANNPNGAMAGFMGMGMAQQAGGMNNIGNLYNMGVEQQSRTQPQAPTANAWKCSCGATATGNFCPECGAKKPARDGSWTCSCGAVNKGRFCTNCGAKKPEGSPLYRCDKCGWEPEDPKNPPKFCPNCGDPFNENDIR
ncbi:MAG: SPFH domain-containing protein [Clostridia bacterium]|nr:SPFH domain-containing protein [Clostridia bacterium]